MDANNQVSSAVSEVIGDMGEESGYVCGGESEVKGEVSGIKSNVSGAKSKVSDA